MGEIVTRTGPLFNFSTVDLIVDGLRFKWYILQFKTPPPENRYIYENGTKSPVCKNSDVPFSFPRIQF
jgi:hypothetical protein